MKKNIDMDKKIWYKENVFKGILERKVKKGARHDVQ